MRLIKKQYKAIIKNRLIVLVLVLSIVIFIESYVYIKTSKSAVIFARDTFNHCEKSKDSKEQCYAKAFYKLTQKNPFEFSVRVLEELQILDPKNAIGCHFISHKISQAETEKNPDNWKELLGSLDFNKCTGGFLHGVIEAHLAIDPDFTINIDSANLICNQIVKNAPSRRSCFHIMGHLTLFENKADIGKAVDACEPFEDGMPKYECLSGVFMENLTREYLFAHGVSDRLAWTLENSKKIEKLCAEFEGLPQKACWKEISYMYWSIYDTDEKKLFEACSKAPTEEAATDCFLYGAGNMLVSHRFDMKRLPEVCSVYKTSDPRYRNCTRNLIGSLLNTSIKNLDDTIQLCSGIGEETQPFCFNSIFQLLTIHETDKVYIEHVCESKPKAITTKYCSS